SAYLNGRGEWWTASIGGDAVQITEPYLADAFAPYERLPRATFQGEHALLGGMVWGLNAEYVNFSKNSFEELVAAPNTFKGVDPLEGQRVDLYPYLAYPIETSAYFLRPELGVRYTAYDLRDLSGYAATNPFAPQFSNTSPSRSVPIFDVD